ncbi:Alg9-like mannosyltransferase family-domain-containing protein [Halteromyces radiatus]|uniref:Alg9-like mannosyltransferase family-domain-containing protein n=1 Tax=Halteromyces radiatus TaxID=101107 RepID=UPI00221E46B4|nr:Alg9-like mannosyltransferase family-domain-containing protein [Halteromyces radiatus]KAI8093719.1 Alg9-like mannosyltransferase family-domain-containing protein [Halteromyces radiatus]
MATYSLTKKIYGNEMAPFILSIILGSWFHFLMSARTLSNSMETVLTIIAMKDWPFPSMVDINGSSWIGNYRKSLLWASLACITRPTNALIWVFLGLQLLYYSSRRYLVLMNAGLIVSLVLMINIGLDTVLYKGGFDALQHGDIVFVPWTFIKTNVLESISVFYGAHPFHWYLSQGLPLMLLTYLPLTAIGMIYNNKKGSRNLIYLVMWVVGVYSFLSHKEFRFIYPIFPLLLMFTAHGLSVVWNKSSRRWRWILIAILWIPQCIFALYVSLWHQRGVMDVMVWLGEQTPSSSSIGFLMPCHSTPWHSVMHQPEKKDIMWFLTCEPPILNDNNKTTADVYMDQADIFYQDPVTFLSKDMPYSWPDYLVMFDPLLQEPGIKTLLLQNKGYTVCQRFFNSHVHWDHRRKGDVIVLCAPSTLP